MRLRRKKKPMAVAAGLLVCLLLTPASSRLLLELSGAQSAVDVKGLSESAVASLDAAAGQAAARFASAGQLALIADFQQQHPNSNVRWDDFSGSPDVMYGFAVETGAGDAEAAARNFIASQGDLFGVADASTLALDPSKSRDALGGHLIRFNQTFAGIPVHQAGVGVVLDGENRVRAVSGPYYRDVSIDTTPLISGSEAVTQASLDLAPFAVSLSQTALDALNPHFSLIESQLGVLATPAPELRIYPMADGYRLAWKFFQFSRNPFGLFEYMVDAHTGEILYRENRVRTQSPLDMTADYFPTSPPITPQLKNDGAIIDANGGETGRPLGQIRIQLRKFDESNRVSGQYGVLTGDHALITNALPGQLPFGQAALGTWHFAQDNLPVEARTNERAHFGVGVEPSEHQDEISQFIYITSLIEYLDYMHRAGDAVHSRGLGQGSFPDDYPNSETPLSGTVHIANVLDPPSDTGDPEFLDQLLGLDNAFAVPVSETVAGQEVVINPTFYGHGYLLNDLAIDFAVPLHEGTHATITPIAGLEGAIEGSALNEGQADLWAYSIGETGTLGEYIVNAFRYRQYLASLGVDPDDVRWIRHADSQIRYSQLGTRNNAFEEHRDGEIYAGAMWDVRQLMLQFETGGPYLRPNAITGQATDSISLGKETWERIFLGSMYVLGTMSPDTFVRARDALIIADSVLYPENPVDPETSGRHRALIEQVFAAREIGANAAAPSGGRQTISTAVTAFAANQAKPAAPQGVTVVPVASDVLRVDWQPVSGAFAYQVLKRYANSPQKRLFMGVPGREYNDGDDPDQLSGFTHVEYVVGGGNTSYLDNGQHLGPHAGLGLDTLDYEYVVRALSVNSNGQVGVSDLSGTASAALAQANVTDAIRRTLSNVSFQNGVFEFDQTLQNLGGAGAFDGTIYAPVTMRIISISDPTVTVANADNGGSGQNGDTADFGFAGSLRVNESSAPRRLRFNDPAAKLFTFDALVTGRVQVDAVPANGSQPADGELDPSQGAQTYHFDEEFVGLVPIGSAGLQLVDGVDYVDVEFTAQPSAIGVEATLSADVDVAGAYPDVDFALLDSQGNELNSSGNLGPNEAVGAGLVGGETYFFRVIGFANGPTLFRIASRQTVTEQTDAGGAAGASQAEAIESSLIRFTVNPITKSVTVQALR